MILYKQILVILFTAPFLFIAYNQFRLRSNNDLLDQPNSRSSHNKPVPRGAGFIFSTYLSIVSLFSGDYFLLCAYLLSIFGFLDDKFNLSSSLRFSIQVISSLLLIKFLPYTILDRLSFISLITYIFLLLIGTTIINFTNFLDCLDGLIAGTMMIIFLTLSPEYPTLFPLILALSIFIFFNWHPAKLFMGDAGSTYLGSIFFFISLNSSEITIIIGRLLLASPILLDAFMCLLMRYKAGYNIFKAHRMHLAQRLYQSGWSHSKVSFLYITLTSLMCLSYLFGNIFYSLILFFIIILIGLFLNSHVATKFPKSNSEIS